MVLFSLYHATGGTELVIITEKAASPSLVGQNATDLTDILTLAAKRVKQTSTKSTTCP